MLNYRQDDKRSMSMGDRVLRDPSTVRHGHGFAAAISCMASVVNSVRHGTARALTSNWPRSNRIAIGSKNGELIYDPI